MKKLQMLRLGPKRVCWSLRLELAAQGMAQTTCYQSCVWYHSAIQAPQILIKLAFCDILYFFARIRCKASFWYSVIRILQNILTPLHSCALNQSSNTCRNLPLGLLWQNISLIVKVSPFISLRTGFEHTTVNFLNKECTTEIVNNFCNHFTIISTYLGRYVFEHVRWSSLPIVKVTSA